MSSTTTSHNTTLDIIESTTKIKSNQNDTGTISNTNGTNIIFLEKSRIANSSKQQTEQPN